MKTTDYLRLLRQYKESFADKYGIERIGIFGSVARGEQTKDSDVDIVVHRKCPKLGTKLHLRPVALVSVEFL